mgnify:CR=1 FL=1
MHLPRTLYLEQLEHGTIYERALAVAFRYGGVGGSGHKAWVIDQMVRVLAGSAYPEFVETFKETLDGRKIYTWDGGIAP